MKKEEKKAEKMEELAVTPEKDAQKKTSSLGCCFRRLPLSVMQQEQ